MVRCHVIEIGLFTLDLMIVAMMLVMWWVSQYPRFVVTAMTLLMILGLLVGTLIPDIVVT